MDFRTKIRELIKTLLENIHERRKLILALSCAVVFVTTYVLILPAFTLDKEEAAEQGGIDMPAVEQTVDADKIQAESSVEENADSAVEEKTKEEAAETDNVNSKAASEDKNKASSKFTLRNDEGDDFVVEVEGKDAGLSEDMSLAVREIDQSDKKQKKEYESLYNDALEVVQKTQEEEGLEKPSEFAFAKFYDISLMDGDTEVEPDDAVDVKISFSKNLQKELKVEDPDGIHIVHFAMDKETGEITPEVLDADTTDITVRNNKVTEAAFTADSFSVFAVVYSQLTTNVLTADGKTYKITVTFDEDAGIPAGTELIATEIEFGTDEYNQNVGRLWSEANKEYFKVEEMREHYVESMGLLPDVHMTNINMARFFDVSLVNNGRKIEPKAPVEVEISYDEGLYAPEGTTPGVVHFASDKDIEIISEVNTAVSGNDVTSFRYQQDSFSDIGTYVGQEINDIINEPNLPSTPNLSEKSEAKAVGLPNNVIEDIILSNAKPYGPLRAGETESEEQEKPSEEDETGLNLPEGNKTLTPNKNGDQDDGTYTLSLSVKGHSTVSSEEVVKKSNILFVMDRSSSMITKTVSDDTTRWYYGTKNTSSWRGDLTENNGYRFIGIVDDREVDLNVSYGGFGGGSYYNPVITYRSGTNQWGQAFYSNYPDDAPIYVESKKTRMTAEQEALSNLFNQLLAKNEESGDRSDVVELSLISFGDERFDDKPYKDETEVGWTKGDDPSSLINAVSSNRFTSGTNWEEALQYAYDEISNKKQSDGDKEDYYVVFLTDGEPTAKEGNKPNHADTPNLEAYDAAKDEAKDLVDSGIKFYNIFTYRKNEDVKYSIYLTNYAYGEGDHNQSQTTDAVKNYFSDAQTPEDVINALNNIFYTVEDAIGHANVSITDTLTTDAMTTTVVHGKTNGYEYKVTKPNPEDPNNPTTLYTVTTTGDLTNPTVTFHVPDSSQKDYVATASTVVGKTVYSVTTAEGKTYKMALADINDQTGELTWDLSAVGMLMDDCTYSVNFVVWPNQEAYDYVAALNNGLKDWVDDPEKNPKYEDLRSTKGYEKGGVQQYPSIVKYPDGTFAVLTNEEQKLHYSVVETKTENGETTTNTQGPYYIELPLPEPMKLTASSSQIEKVWNIERDPDILAHILYGNPNSHYSIPFNILQDDTVKPYTSVGLGWDEEKGKYIWSNEEDELIYVKWDNSKNKYVKCDEEDENALPLGTHWTKDFSIATGLMLSEDRMDDLGLDKTAYTCTTYPEEGGTKYYLLEEGHDYTIEEPDVGFEYDFEAPIYHPMLVDGVLKNVDIENIVKDSNGKVASYDITGISPIDVAEGGRSALEITNTLRGYIHLNKVVVGQDDKELKSDLTDFTYDIELNNSEPLFKGDHIPWYGISGLFYHDKDNNYYQAEIRNSRLLLTTEDGGPYEATCTAGFDPKLVTKQTITYIDTDDIDENGNGKSKTVEIYGNRMTPDEDSGNNEAGYKKVTARLHINQNQTLNIANIPLDSSYTITEADDTGYQLVSIKSDINDKPVQNPDVSGSTINGVIVSNSDNHIIYTNKRVVTDIKIKKTDENGKGLPGAVFQLLYKDKDDGSYRVLTDADGVTGLGSVKVEDTTYTSAFESDGGEKILTRLPDGEYKLDEVYVPAGYINTLGSIYFTIEEGVISSRTADSSELVELSPSGTMKLLTVTNEPGAALPHTGGPGTCMIHLLGITLTGIAGAGLVMKRRRRNAANNHYLLN